MNSEGVRLLGVDGCPAGWVVAESASNIARALPLAAPTFWIAASFAELLAKLAGALAVVCVDIPVGLPTGRPRDDGVRAADRAIRAFLGGRRVSSVFSAPCRPTLDADTYPAACAAELAARGVRLSRQAFGIIPKIREVDRAITPRHQAPLADADVPLVREVHPEAVFALLAGGGERGHGLTQGKRTAAGETARLALLTPCVGAVDIGAERRRLMASVDPKNGTGRRGRVVGRDDIVDALACLVVAYRIAEGEARTFPDGPPQCDERGLRMEILA